MEVSDHDLGPAIPIDVYEDGTRPQVRAKIQRKPGDGGAVSAKNVEAV